MTSSVLMAVTEWQDNYNNIKSVQSQQHAIVQGFQNFSKLMSPSLKNHTPGSQNLQLLVDWTDLIYSFQLMKFISNE